MSMKLIYNFYKTRDVEFTSLCPHRIEACLTFQGRKYIGVAWCHNADFDWESERVGRSIALSRARAEALKYLLTEAQNEYKYKEQMYSEVVRSPEAKCSSLVGVMAKNLMRAGNRVNVIKDNLRHEKQWLKNYLKTLEKNHEKITTMREAALGKGKES